MSYSSFCGKLGVLLFFVGELYCMSGYAHESNYLGLVSYDWTSMLIHVGCSSIMGIGLELPLHALTLGRWDNMIMVPIILVSLAWQ